MINWKPSNAIFFNIQAIVGALEFGVWQQSLAAGVFFWVICCLFFIATSNKNPK